ncbi:DUF4241 domain-containing protein [Kribbella sp. NPDC058245]|uniref:DUF4241 domain-containing protein n=1 Tax=Kribbella sp. NPDC058245 TaxID=3346399 RepID=UPI0036E67296
MFSLTGDMNDAVMVVSGYGDGAYPCYWGVVENGTIASLVVDFLVLAGDSEGGSAGGIRENEGISAQVAGSPLIECPRPPTLSTAQPLRPASGGRGVHKGDPATGR